MADSDRTVMKDFSSVSTTVTEQLIAFESRYQSRHAGERALKPGLDERKLHDARVYKRYGKMKDNTTKTFAGFCGRWVSFCENKGYHMLDTTTKDRARAFEQERLRPDETSLCNLIALHTLQGHVLIYMQTLMAGFDQHNSDTFTSREEMHLMTYGVRLGASSFNDN